MTQMEDHGALVLFDYVEASHVLSFSPVLRRGAVSAIAYSIASLRTRFLRRALPTGVELAYVNSRTDGGEDGLLARAFPSPIGRKTCARNDARGVCTGSF